MTLSIFLLRHGQTEASKGDVFSGSGMNPHLTADGQEMAQCFADAYKSHRWAAVYTSPLVRAIETATPLCTAINQSPELRDGLKEIDYGVWDGKNKEFIETNFHDDYLKWNADPEMYAPTGGETARQIARRSGALIEEIIAKHTDGNVLVVAHKATIRIMICALLGIPLARFRDRITCPVGSVTKMEMRAHGPLLALLADRAHQTERLRNLPGS